MGKPVLLDLFCGAGGAAAGYARAGFDVVGVDIQPQPHYPFTFIQADAIAFLDIYGTGTHLLRDFDVVHASPPCQGYSPHVSSASSKWAGTRGADEPRLIASLRKRLSSHGIPYVIENVVGARDEMRVSLSLCGTMFGLPIARHRLFESNMPMSQPEHPRCTGVAKRYAEAKGWDPRDMTVTGKGRHAGTSDRWREIMGWPADHAATQHELREAIPPAYTDFVGKLLLETLHGAV